MFLNDLVDTSRRVAETGSRNAKRDLLAELLKRAAPDEIETVIAWLSGYVRQQKTGAGWATLSGALSGEAAATPSLSLGDVHATLDALVGTSGKGSAKARDTLLRDLFGRATAAERDFLFRLLTGELRQGANEGLMMEAVARASGLDSATVRRAAMMAGDLSVVAYAALTEGAAGLERYRIQLFRPVQPMLAQPAEAVAAALAEGATAFEYKVDGARIQVHKRGDEVRVYSRALNEVTGGVPDVVGVARSLKANELILDGEAIALRPDGTPYPFQVTMSRFGQPGALSSFYFDILYRDGASLLDEPYTRRAEILAEVVPAKHLLPRRITTNADEAQAFFDRARAEGHEGLMAKAPASLYQAGARGSAWLKIKAAHTLDLVVLAVEWGSGRRKGWLSNLHLGVRDPATGGFVMLGKTFKGMTDEMLKWQTERLLQLETHREGHVVYVRPELVVEVAFNDVQASSHYPGGMALRFARVKGYRPDKTAAEADTADTVRKLLPS